MNCKEISELKVLQKDFFPKIPTLLREGLKRKLQICVSLLFCVQQLFSMEFSLEYENRLDQAFFKKQFGIISSLSSPQSAFFLSDTKIAFDSSSIFDIYEHPFFVLDYETNTVTRHPLSFIEDLIEIVHIYGTTQDNEIILCYNDSSHNIRYALVNFDNYSYIQMKEDEIYKYIQKYNPFKFLSSQVIHGNYQLSGYSDQDTKIDAWGIEDTFYKLSIIKSPDPIYYTEWNELDNLQYIDTLTDSMGHDVIFTVWTSFVYFDEEKEKLIAFSTFDSESKGTLDFSIPTLYIYKLIYDATCNDTRVRIREEPNLSCSTLGYLNAGDAVKVTDKSNDPFEIDGESWYWYKVESDTLPDGWVYGKYLDIEE